ncbi:unnamed protein product [Rotaria sp. Silwood2]|nr:unnamed protein product [Rotaria sp. Silwood2]
MNLSIRNTSITDIKFTTDQLNLFSSDGYVEPFSIIAVVILNDESDEDRREAIADKQQSTALSNDIYNWKYSTLNEDNHNFTDDLESNTELDRDFYLFESSPSETREGESDSDENEEITQIIDFIRSANLDKSNTDGLLDLLNNIQSNVGLPKSGRELWKRVGVKFTFKTNIYCSNCNRQLSRFCDKCNCPNGNQNMNIELILFSIPDEIRQVVKMNFDLIEFFANYRHEFMYDITNEILPPAREYQRNVILFALYHSTNSPTADMLLGNIVKTIKRLQTYGLLINLGEKDKPFNINVQLIVGDLPGRSKYSLLSGHTDYFSCTRCLLEGTHCNIHRHILYSWHEYQTTCPEPRTQENIDNCVNLIEVSKTNIRSFGVLGKSPLSTILSIPTQCVFDYFHIRI